jgi:hypothetical protein
MDPILSWRSFGEPTFLSYRSAGSTEGPGEKVLTARAGRIMAWQRGRAAFV